MREGKQQKKRAPGGEPLRESNRPYPATGFPAVSFREFLFVLVFARMHPDAAELLRECRIDQAEAGGPVLECASGIFFNRSETGSAMPTDYTCSAMS